MTYAEHLRALIVAAQTAVPSLTYRSLSQRAGLGLGWVSDFMTKGTGTLSRAEAVIAAIRALCPPDETGDELRRLLARFDEDHSDREDAA